MTNVRRTFVCLFILVWSATPQSVTDGNFNSLVSRLEKRDSRAIWDAAKSGDARFIPYLKLLLKDKQLQLSGDSIAVRVAMARLGDEQTLREYACEMSFGPDLAQYDAILESPGVGGWASIRALTEVLRRRKAPKDPFHYRRFYDLGDEAFAPGYYYALETLPAVVPNPPYPGLIQGVSFDNSEERTESWIHWIDEHSAELRKLKPNTEVDVSSESCNSTLRNDLFMRHKAK